MSKFIGRDQELRILEGLLKKTTASLVVLRGRLRIGKSRLAAEFTHSFEKSYSFVGVPPEKGITAQDQRIEFARQMKRAHIPYTNVDDWGDLFTDLALFCAKGKTLIILDEITWMGALDPTFLPKLKTIWDVYFTKNPRCVLLLSGSNSSWIEENILSSTGFVGRISCQMQLKELPLYLCIEFFGKQATNCPYEKLKIFSIVGGIPRYLEEIRTDLTAEQNIFQLCYQPSGMLFHEFNHLFSDLFSQRNAIYKDLILQVAQNHSTLKEITQALSRKRGGDLTKHLDELCAAGFLSKDKGWDIAKGKEKRIIRYRICDNYVRFYLRYIEPYAARIQSGQITVLPQGYQTIMGLQFENLVCNNRESLFSALQLLKDEVIWAWPYFQTATNRHPACQIDFLIQTKYKVLYLCEIKFSEREVPFSVIDEVRKKARCISLPRGFSLRYVLIHVNGVEEKVIYDGFFSNIIDFKEFLKAP